MRAMPEIRRMGGVCPADAIKLVTEVFMAFEAPDYSSAGVQAFLDTAVNNPTFMSSLSIYGAYIGRELVGVIATRKRGSHIALFFVDGAHHRQGIGRRLFEAVLEDAPSDTITVNSSPYAQDVYRHLGFEAVGEEQMVTGIRFTPMRYRK